MAIPNKEKHDMGDKNNGFACYLKRQKMVSRNCGEILPIWWGLHRKMPCLNKIKAGFLTFSCNN